MMGDKEKGGHWAKIEAALSRMKARASESVPYEPVDCPSGGPKQQCNTLNEWGKAWEAWGQEVKDAIDAMGGGGPTGVSPPPKPPYKP